MASPVPPLVPKAKYQPSEFLKSVMGRPVVVKLNSGVDYRGVLACLDGYMNIAMEQTEEYVGGQLKAKYGDCFIRGNNGAVGPSCATDILLSHVCGGVSRLNRTLAHANARTSSSQQTTSFVEKVRSLRPT